MQGAKTTDSGDDRDDTDRRDGAVQTSPRACVVDVSFRRVVAKDTTLGGGGARRRSHVEGTSLGAPSKSHRRHDIGGVEGERDIRDV